MPFNLPFKPSQRY
ncbi:uncharacterized protein FFMR_04105 [Fusarium fujikuroi]|nr:uncharacterized protein FFMR_04105 [Fusarium fujikuroi]